MRTLLVSSSVADPVCSLLRRALRDRLDSQTPVVTRYDEAEKSLARVQPEVLLVALSGNPEHGLEAIRRLRQAAGCCILAVGHTAEPKLILRALNSGADHFLDEADLDTGLDAVVPRLRARQDATPPAGRLLAVLGVSGGSGASTLAVNLAAALARDHGKAALVDLKPGRGDLAALLDLKPAFHLADLCQSLARLDQAMFARALVPHGCGVSLLASPQVYGDARLVRPEAVAEVLALARRTFPHVVADLEDCFHEEQVVALRQAAAVLLVSRLDFTSLRNLRRVLEHIEERGIPRERVQIAVNRHGQPGELAAEDAEEAIGDKLSYFIPDDPRTVNGANNTGVPAVLKAPSARVSVALAQMARDLLDRRNVPSAVTATAAS